MKLKRLKQVFHYGRLHAKQIAEENNLNTIVIFCDIMRCYFKYRMWSNQYLKENFYMLNVEQRESIGRSYKSKNSTKEEWIKDFYANIKFLNKYSSRKYDEEGLRDKRVKAYRRRYNIGDGLALEHDVTLSRQHHLPGRIEIGNNVLLAKHVFIRLFRACYNK